MPEQTQLVIDEALIARAKAEMHGKDLFSNCPSSIKDLWTAVEEETDTVGVFGWPLRAAFFKYIENDNVMGMRLCLALASKYVSIKIITNDRFTAAICAARNGSIKALEFLADQGTNLNERSYFGETALMQAAQFCHTSAVSFLISKGVDLEAKDTGGRTAVMYAAEYGNIESLKALADAGVDLNVKDKHGMTATMVAAKWGQTEKLRLLADRGADLDASDNHGWTAAMYAADYPGFHKEAFQFLIDRGVNPDAKNIYGTTVRRYAEGLDITIVDHPKASIASDLRNQLTDKAAIKPVNNLTSFNAL